MLRSLRLKFLLLLLGVAIVALSGTVILRELMLRDFRAYLEGDAEDKVYWVQAELEGAYQRNEGWKVDAQAEDALWALALGFEMRLLDRQGKLVIDTEKAIRSASPLVRRRLSALSQFRGARNTGEFAPYPLFLAGRQIGTLEARALRPASSALFVGRADRFLLLSVVTVGGLAILLSVLFSHRLTEPIKELALAVSAISRGDLKRRVTVFRSDEVGDLAGTFNRMAGALETQESLRRKLIADVAHELRTPLGVMRGELEAMIDGLIPDDERRLQSLYDETGRLKHVVDAIEELNQAEASRLSLQRRRLDLKPLLENIVERFRGRFQEKGITLELTCSDGQEVYADPERMSQIILNLLSNALKATGAGGHVTVTVAPVQGNLRITVEDTGCGIGEEDLPFIFERFYRGPGGGLGIGLTIVKELVEAQGGKIEAKSAPGKGSSFAVLFPLSVHNSS
jgi:two-component system sensor histidine kinase BaeS